MAPLVYDDQDFMNSQPDTVQLAKVQTELAKLDEVIKSGGPWKDILAVVFNVIGIAKGFI